MEFDFQRSASRFDGPGVRAIALMGSYARGDAGPYSDVDLVRLIDEDFPGPTEPQTHLFDGRLVVVSNVRPSAAEEWFTSPLEASVVIAGVRTARPLLDREGRFAAVQARARAFVWDAAMQAKADAWASREMVGLIEEVHKGLEGLRRGDVGRMLNARFGCTWGLSKVLQVQRGVLLQGDNAFYEQVGEAVGWNSEWTRLRHTAFGIETEGRAPSLSEQIRAGLRLYVETAALLEGAIQPEDRPLIVETVSLVRQSLEKVKGKHGTSRPDIRQCG